MFKKRLALLLALIIEMSILSAPAVICARYDQNGEEPDTLESKFSESGRGTARNTEVFEIYDDDNPFGAEKTK